MYIADVCIVNRVLQAALLFLVLDFSMDHASRRCIIVSAPLQKLGSFVTLQMRYTNY